jgi:tape measure domain-containing protein
MAITASQLVAKVAVEGDADAKAKLKAVGTEQEATSQKMKTGLLSSIKSTAGGFLDFGAKVGQSIIGFKGIADAAIGFGSALIAPNAEMEQTRVSFAAFIPNAQELTKTLADLKKFSATTPFEAPEVNQAALSLLNMNVAAKDTTTWISNLGAAVSKVGGNGLVLDDVAAIISQMGVKGKVTTEEMMQLSERNIPAFKILADAMHVPVATLQDMISKGQLGQDKIELLVQSMGKFGGSAMIEQGKTFNGLLGTVHDNAMQALAAFTGPLFDMAKQGLTTLGDLVSSPQFQDFATMLGQQVGGALQSVGTFIQQNIVPAFTDLGPLIGQIGTYLQGDDFAGFVADVQTVGNQISRILTPAFQQLAPYIPSLKDVLTALGGVITGTVVPALDNIVFPLGQFLLWMQEAGPWQEVIKAGLIGIGVAFAAIQIGSLIATIPALVTGFIAWATTAGAAAISTLLLAAPIILIGAAIALVVAGIILAVTHWGEITAWLSGVWGAFSSWFMGLLGQIGAFFTGIWNSIAGFFVGIWTSITGQAQAGGQALTSWWTGLWNGIQTALQMAWTFLVNIVQVGAQLLFLAIMGPIIAIANGFIWLYQHNVYFQQMIDAIVGFVQAGIAWLQSAWQSVIQFIGAQWQALVSLATSIWGMISNAVTQQVMAVVVSVQQQWNEAMSWLQSAWNKISSMATSVWLLIKNAVMQQIMALVVSLQAQWTTASTWLQTQWNKISTMAQTAWKSVSTVFSGIWNTYISKPMNDLWNQFVNWFNNLKNQATTWGKNAIQGLIDGIKGQITAAGNAAADIANQIASKLGFHSPPPEGPASDSDQWMPNMIDMMASGLRAGIPQIAGATSAIAGSLNPIGGSAAALPSGTSAISPSISSGSPTIIVNVPPSIVEMDGQRLTSVLMPYIVEAIRRDAAGRF